MALGVWAAGVLACGNATCPKDSIAVEGDCVAVSDEAPAEQPIGGEPASADGRMDTGAEFVPDAPLPEPDLEPSAEPSAEPSIEPSAEPSAEPDAEPSAEPEPAEMLDPCEAIDCGAHGACVADGERAACECEHPFGGELCDGCAQGFALDDGGVCQPDCGECGPHAFCDATLTVPACTCVAGYRDDGAGCLWVGDGVSGGIVDGELDRPTAWQSRNVAFVQGAGALAFYSIGTGLDCELGELSQMLTMPEYEQAEPLVLELDLTSNCTATNRNACPPLLVELGGKVTRMRTPSAASVEAPVTVGTCIGRAGYGRERLLSIRPGLARDSGVPFSCENDDWPRIVALRIRAAHDDECPAPDGFFDDILQNPARWSLQSASIGSNALTLDGGNASTRVTFPVPSQLPASALWIGYTLVRTGMFTISLDGLVWSDFRTLTPPDGSRGLAYLCIPDWAQGATHELSVSATTNTSLRISTLEVAADPRCETGRFDEDFDRDLNTGAWSRYNGSSSVRTDAGAPSGTTSLFAEGGAGLRGLMRVPVRNEARDGPAFRFWHRLPSSNLTASYVIIGHQQAAAAYTPLARASTSWNLESTCLGRAWWGQVLPMFLGWNVSVASGTGTAALWIDSAGTGLTSSCD